MANENMQTDRIKQIQEIIFGEHIEQWEKRISSLEKELKNLGTQASENLESVNQRIDQINQNLEKNVSKLQRGQEQGKSHFESQLADFRKEIETKIKRLQDDKADSTALGDVLISLGQQIKQK